MTSLMIAIALLAQQDQQQSTYAFIWNAYLQSQVVKKYIPPDHDSLTVAHTLYIDLLAGKFDEKSKAHWSALGFSLTEAPGGIWILADAKKRGGGFYLFRPKGTTRLMLQAPHAFHDLGTGELALKMFLKEDWQVLGLNTTHRYSITSPKNKSDLAHTPNSFFQQLTHAWCAGGGTLVQIHGFGGKKRKTLAAKGADFIFSQGRRDPQPWMKRWIKGSRIAGLFHIRLYGENVFELGGLQNKQLKACNEVQACRSVHLEIERKTRRELLKKSDQRNVLAEDLTTLARTPL